MLVLVTYTLITKTKKEIVKIVEIVEIAGTSKNGKKSKSGEYLGNLKRVLCISYPITFRKKSMPVLALFNSGSKVNAIYLTFA